MNLNQALPLLKQAQTLSRLKNLHKHNFEIFQTFD